MKAVLIGVFSERYNVRSYKDNRKRVNRIAGDYKGELGVQVIRSFEFERDVKLGDIISMLPKTIDYNN